MPSGSKPAGGKASGDKGSGDKGKGSKAPSEKTVDAPEEAKVLSIDAFRKKPS